MIERDAIPDSVRAALRVFHFMFAQLDQSKLVLLSQKFGGATEKIAKASENNHPAREFLPEEDALNLMMSEIETKSLRLDLLLNQKRSPLFRAMTTGRGPWIPLRAPEVDLTNAERIEKIKKERDDLLYLLDEVILTHGGTDGLQELQEIDSLIEMLQQRATAHFLTLQNLNSQEIEVRQAVSAFYDARNKLTQFLNTMPESGKVAWFQIVEWCDNDDGGTVLAGRFLQPFQQELGGGAVRDAS